MRDDRTTRLPVYRFLGFILGLSLGAGMALGLAGMAQGQTDVTPSADPSANVQPAATDDNPSKDIHTAAALVAATADHLWVVRWQDQTATLVHRTTEDKPGQTHQVRKLEENPVAITAYENHLYLVTASGRMSRISYEKSPVDNIVRYPALVEPPLPIEENGHLIRICAGSQSMFVLYRVDGKENQPATLKLSRLVGGDWKSVELPEHITLDNVLDMAMIDSATNRLAIASGDDSGEQLHLHTLNEKQWQGATYDLAANGTLQLVGVIRNACVVQEENGQWRVYGLRGGEVVSLASPRPEQTTNNPVLAFGRDQQIGLLVIPSDPPMQLLKIDTTAPPNSELKPTELTILIRPPLETRVGSIIMFSLIGLGMLILLSNWNVKPNALAVKLPADLVTCDLPRRFAAVAIDLIPPILIAWLVFGLKNPDEVLQRVSIYGGDWEQVRMQVLAMGLFFSHCTISELFTAKTLGKKLTGCHVTTLNASPPDLWQVLFRNVLKVCEMMLPLLVVFMVLNPFRQRLGDMAARTLVVRKADTPLGESDDNSSRDDPSN